jgi:hypothetical protein
MIRARGKSNSIWLYNEAPEMIAAKIAEPRHSRTTGGPVNLETPFGN